MKTVDFHAHILPSADHGSNGIDMTREQLSLAKNADVDIIVATPHFYPNMHTPNEFYDMVSTAAKQIEDANLSRPEICLGAEVLICENMENMEGIDKLCIRGTDILLVELPFSAWSNDLCYTVKKLSSRYTLVLAHVDRYIEAEPDKIASFIRDGALAQINASSLFYHSVKKKISPLVKEGAVCAIGSDLHKIDKKAYAQFKKSQKKLGEDYLKIMERSAQLLDNAEKF